MMKSGIRVGILALFLSPILQAQPKLEIADGILARAQSEPVEIQAFIISSLMGKGLLTPKQIAEVSAQLRERSITAKKWYPLLPVTRNIAAGYSGILSSSKFGLSGLDIFLNFVRLDKALTPTAVRKFLDTLPKSETNKVRCDLPLYSSRITMYRFLGQFGPDIYPTRNDQLGLFTALAAEIDNPFDYAAFIELISAFKFKDAESMHDAYLAASGSLDHIEMPPCGAANLQTQFGFQVMIAKVADDLSAIGLAETFISRYRSFVIRSLGRPVCSAANSAGRADDAEIQGRHKLVEAINSMIAGNQLAKELHVIDPEEVRSSEKNLRVLDVKPNSLTVPDKISTGFAAIVKEVQKGASGILDSDLLSNLTSSYLRDMRSWEPMKSDDYDIRLFDLKYTYLETLCRANAQLFQKALPEVIAMLGDAVRLKAEHPQVWLGYAMRILDLVYRVDRTSGVPVPPEGWALTELSRSPDATFHLLAELR